MSYKIIYIHEIINCTIDIRREIKKKMQILHKHKRAKKN